jgi:hypothetical protein
MAWTVWHYAMTHPSSDMPNETTRQTTRQHSMKTGKVTYVAPGLNWVILEILTPYFGMMLVLVLWVRLAPDENQGTVEHHP